jgi:ABC-2 type transport system ATP-binding protein
MSVSNQAQLADLASEATLLSSPAPAIQAVNLSKVFGDRVCVDQLSFTVYEGELYALLGDNGAGKTTTINMLTTLLRPSSGQIFLCGFDAVKQSEKTKGAFGVVSQEVALYGELTAYENLAFIADLYGLPKKQSDARIQALLQQSGLADRAHDLAGTFSTGMQRKLSIAIAMLHQPKVIFMDEPTVGLDPASRRSIWEALMQLKRAGVTVLLTTHYLEEAEFLADRIGIIRKGKMIVEGTIDQLRAQLRAVRTVNVECNQPIDADRFAQMSSRFTTANGGTAEMDAFRGLIVLTPPVEAVLTDYLEQALSWLKRERIAFEKFATSEPSLEEIFLSVQAGRGTGVN